MPRPRLSLLQAIATGAAKTNPARFRDRFAPSLPPVGPAPDWLNSTQRQAWGMFTDELPHLCSADRCILEVASRLRARLILEQDPPVQVMGLLRQILSQLGCTPATRARLAPPAAPDEPETIHFA